MRSGPTENDRVLESRPIRPPGQPAIVLAYTGDRITGRRTQVETLAGSRQACHQERFGFYRIHRSFAVNLEGVRLVRNLDRGRDWEVKMEPPVNRILPIGRSTLPGLLAALGATTP